MCTLRIVILRTANRPRTAPTVRLSLSAIIVGLFPASTMSRNCLSSSGSQRRRWLRALIPPAVSLCAALFDPVHARHRSYRVVSVNVPRSHRVMRPRFDKLSQDEPTVLNGTNEDEDVLVGTFHKCTQLSRRSESSDHWQNNQRCRHSHPAIRVGSHAIRVPVGL